ncbi:hypothetical protein BN1708_011235 [Verticillium longisporum]|uniref:Acyl-CoA oxidase C-terminal domain-containing protein n=1 Tax=Verticillium longisporum TaxID=100787 RepID=A0A0G4KYE3_VERLO|nr:hypothetical protein BN1708_011235 [Verticillium longisporum]
MDPSNNPYLPLLRQDVWKIGPKYETMSVPQQVRLSYRRAKSIAKHINMTVADITNLSPKFWDFHLNLVCSADTATTTILTIHWNLCMGTIAMHGATQPHTHEVLESLARFEICGEFMLTEVGHGLDARNIETVATLQDDGSFDLHTPHESAAKVMPPTTLWAGMPRRRRIATMKQNETTPIITFSTQHTPVIDALTQASILEAFANWTVGQFKAQSTNARIQGALACVFKETAIHFGQATMSELMDRCGWQGLYTHNQVCELALAQRGTSVAEGDTLVLCIRLVTELMLGRYTLPEPVDPTSLLSKHEIGVWEEAAKMVESVMALDERQRDDGFNTFLLPRCRQLVQATGQRMSYEAAKATPSIRSEILRLWEMTCIQDDVSWYVANTDLDRIMIFKQHSEAVKAVLPFLDQLLNESGGEAWTTAPFLNDNDWNKFLNGLESFGYPDTPGDQRMEAHDRGFLKRLPSTLLTKKNIVAVRCLLRLKPRDIISRH